MQHAPTKDATSEDVDRIVAAYLRERGYKHTEAAFADEAKPPTTSTSASKRGRPNDDGVGAVDEASIPDFLLYYSETEANNPNAYEHSYARLGRWVKDSLEKYRPELSTVLFPLFAHAYLDLVSRSMGEQARHFMDTYRKEHMDMHSHDVTRLASITTPDQVKSNELAVQFMSNRYTVRMSRYAFELLLSFLQDNKFMLLTRLLNRHVTIRVDNERAPGDVEEGVGLVGLKPAQLDEHNNQPVKLGSLPADPWLVHELEWWLRDDKFEGEPQSAELRKLIKREGAEDAPHRDDVPQPPPKFSDVKKETEALKEALAQLSKKNVAPTSPSICCYTFHNTYDTMTCLTSSSDNSLVMAGFSESILKVWSLKGEKLKTATLGASKEISWSKEEESKKLIGHSGPVYNCRISSDNKFAVSCSEDTTVRLWSLETFSNLVVYKGHNYPVWDVDLASNDVYFASCGFDRTARMWRTDMTTPVRMFVGHESDVDCVKFHPNSNYLASGASDGEVRLWSIQKGTSARILRSHTAPVMALAFSADGKLLATAGEDKMVKLWDLGSGKLMKNLTGHTDTVYSLAFNADGSMLASGGADNSVVVWNPRNLEDGGVTVVPPNADVGVSGLGKSKTHTSPEMVGRFFTKRTPIFNVNYTKSNVLLAFGPFLSS
ncbi:WD40 repeat-like protein [Rhizoclosmatium globosum]|uniref:WD40 repeat-like protein n=1 Tax=Rhizoclosmatium globosum TaxID=329046 RepID=A0A1Y2CE19_9FUNG|nr:WD40 repeat-like protein [Rhizoclosmatium globosum]|eukprot:ORY45310.1 WD40 repeat-like protein [Rhizoclosmatium globosum]